MLRVLICHFSSCNVDMAINQMLHTLSWDSKTNFKVDLIIHVNFFKSVLKTDFALKN